MKYVLSILLAALMSAFLLSSVGASHDMVVTVPMVPGICATACKCPVTEEMPSQGTNAWCNQGSNLR